VNGGCKDKPYQCICNPGWQGKLCDQPEVTNYGSGERVGRCLPVGSFLCMAGGRDRCLYDGAGKLVGRPRCICPDNREGTYCERMAGIEPRLNITAEGTGQGITVVQLKSETPNKVLEVKETQSVEKLEDEATGSDQIKDLSKTSAKSSYPEVVTESNHQAIHGDMGSRVEPTLGPGEGLFA